MKTRYFLRLFTSVAFFVCSTHLIGFGQQVSTIAFSPDGSKILTGSSNGKLKLWNTKNGKLLINIKTGKERIKSISFSKDASQVILSTDEFEGINAFLFDLRTGKKVYENHYGSEGIGFATFSPDNQHFLVGNPGNYEIEVVDVASKKIIKKFSVIYSDQERIAFGKNKVYAIEHKSLVVWNMKTKQQQTIFKLKSKPEILALDISGDETKALIAQDKSARMFSLKSGKFLKAFGSHNQEVLSVVFSSDGKFVATGSKDKSAKIWNVKSGKLLHTLNEHSENIYSVAFSKNSKQLATVGPDGVKLWNTKNGKLIGDFKNKTKMEEVKAVFSPNGKFLLTALGKNKAQLWNVKTGKLIREF